TLELHTLPLHDALPILARALGGCYRLLIPDLPGWGESQRKPDQAYGFVEQAANVAAFIAALAPDRPVILLGHSMGGGIAALVARSEEHTSELQSRENLV